MSSPTSSDCSFASDPGCQSRSPSQPSHSSTVQENSNLNTSAGSSPRSPSASKIMATASEQEDSTGGPPRTLRKVKRYSTSCPPPAKHPKFMPNYGDLDPEEARESILTGGLFKPINFYGSCCPDSGDEDNLGTTSGSHGSSDEDNLGTRSGSHVSIDSAYCSDGVAKNSPPDPTPDGASSRPNQTQTESGIEYALEKAEADTSTPSSGKGKKKLKIEAMLHCKTLWKTFLAVGNEMIVTKPGRSLFPSLVVTLYGLEPKKEYNIYARVAQANKRRYKYINRKWCEMGPSDVSTSTEMQMYRHPNSPCNGYTWMKNPVSFKGLKITNNPRSSKGNILLHTMNKYILKLIIVAKDNPTHPTTITLHDTVFIAVSAYQSMTVTQMKINYNPYAKAFKYKEGKNLQLALPHSQSGGIEEAASSASCIVSVPRLTAITSHQHQEEQPSLQFAAPQVAMLKTAPQPMQASLQPILPPPPTLEPSSQQVSALKAAPPLQISVLQGTSKASSRHVSVLQRAPVSKVAPQKMSNMPGGSEQMPIAHPVSKTASQMSNMPGALEQQPGQEATPHLAVKRAPRKTSSVHALSEQSLVQEPAPRSASDTDQGSMPGASLAQEPIPHLTVSHLSEVSKLKEPIPQLPAEHPPSVTTAEPCTREMSPGSEHNLVIATSDGEEAEGTPPPKRAKQLSGRSKPVAQQMVEPGARQAAARSAQMPVLPIESPRMVLRQITPPQKMAQAAPRGPPQPLHISQFGSQRYFPRLHSSRRSQMIPQQLAQHLRAQQMAMWRAPPQEIAARQFFPKPPAAPQQPIPQTPMLQVVPPEIAAEQLVQQQMLLQQIGAQRQLTPEEMVAGKQYLQQQLLLHQQKVGQGNTSRQLTPEEMVQEEFLQRQLLSHHLATQGQLIPPDLAMGLAPQKPAVSQQLGVQQNAALQNSNPKEPPKPTQGSLFLPLNGPPQFRPHRPMARTTLHPSALSHGAVPHPSTKRHPGNSSQPHFLSSSNVDLAPIAFPSPSLPRPIPPNDNRDPIIATGLPEPLLATSPSPANPNNDDIPGHCHAGMANTPSQVDHNGNLTNLRFTPFRASSLPDLDPSGDHSSLSDGSSIPILKFPNDAAANMPSSPKSSNAAAQKLPKDVKGKLPASLSNPAGDENVGPTTMNCFSPQFPNGRPAVFPTMLRQGGDSVSDMCPAIPSLPQPTFSTAAGVGPIPGPFPTADAGMVPILTHPNSCTLAPGVAGPVVVPGTPIPRARPLPYPKPPKSHKKIPPIVIPSMPRPGASPVFVPTTSLQRQATNQPFLPFPTRGFGRNFTWLPPVASPQDDPLTAPLLSRLLYPQYYANPQGMPREDRAEGGGPSPKPSNKPSNK